MDDFSLVEAVDGFGECVVVGISHAADRRLDADLGQALGVFDRDVLAASVAVVDQAAATNGTPIMESLFQGIDGQNVRGRPTTSKLSGVSTKELHKDGARVAR
jgi:hypothetical protein